jgi:hypothetical protein
MTDALCGGNQNLQRRNDYLTDINTTLHSDVVELRALHVETEAATKRKEDHRDLPSAYRDPDDEDRYPPYYPIKMEVPPKLLVSSV